VRFCGVVLLYFAGCSLFGFGDVLGCCLFLFFLFGSAMQSNRGAFLFLPAPQEQKGLFTAFGGRGLFLFWFFVQGTEHLKGGFFRSTGAGYFCL